MRCPRLQSLARVVVVATAFAEGMSLGQSATQPGAARPQQQPPQAYRFGAYTRAIGGLKHPQAIAIDDDGLIYVVQTASGQIDVFNVQAAPIAGWGSIGDQPGQFIAPSGIALHGEDVYIADAGTHLISVFDKRGGLKRQWGGRGREPGKFNRPAGVAVTPDRVYVADSGNGRVQAFDHGGQFIAAFGKPDGEAHLRRPADVAVDDVGHIYVADARAHRVLKFDAQGALIKAWGEWGPFPGLFDEPASIVHARGRLYVVDRRNHRVQMFDLEGILLEEWGVHEFTPHEGNGKLHYPDDLAISDSGEFAVICETIEDRLQVYAPLAPGTAPAPTVMFDKANQTHFGEHLDIDGRILAVAEPENHFVFVFDIGGEVPIIINQFGERGDKFGLMLLVAGIDVDLDGHTVLLSDVGTSRLQDFRIDFDPKAPRRINPELMRFATAWDFDRVRDEMARPKLTWPIEPVAIRRDRSGNLFVADAGNDCILVFDRQMKLINRWGDHGGGAGQFRSPTAIALAPGGDEVFIVDSLNRRVQVFTSSGKFVRQWGSAGDGPGQFLLPFGIVVGQDGSVYITDTAAHRVSKWNQAGTFIAQWSGRGAGMGELWKPRGIALDQQQSRLFVIDQGNHRAQIFGLNGQWQVTFGAGRAFTPAAPPPQQPTQQE